MAICAICPEPDITHHCDAEKLPCDMVNLCTDHANLAADQSWLVSKIHMRNNKKPVHTVEGQYIVQPVHLCAASCNLYSIILC